MTILPLIISGILVRVVVLLVCLRLSILLMLLSRVIGLLSIRCRCIRLLRILLAHCLSISCLCCIVSGIGLLVIVVLGGIIRRLLVTLSVVG